jgi:catechol-2,3-dioxygenase
MPSRLAVIVIDAVDPEVVAGFWCAVLGWSILEREHGGITIGDEERSWPVIDVYAVPETKTTKNRLHFDLRADGLSTSQELERLLELGARRVDIGQPPDASWVVLADPEGNEFCLLSRSVQQLRPPPS